MSYATVRTSLHLLIVAGGQLTVDPTVGSDLVLQREL